MKYRLKIAQPEYEKLQQLVLADLPREAGAFALAGIARHDETTDVIVRRVIEVPKEDFIVQSDVHLEISSRAINGLISLCQSNSMGAVLCHSHPADIPYSPSDDHGENRVFATLRNFVPVAAPTASLLIYPAGVRGRIWLPGSPKPVPLSEIVIVGRRIRVVKEGAGAAKTNTVDDDIFNRNILAYGKEGQALIELTKVGIVGVGGTGSAVAEQLVRLGVRDLVLVDPDVFEESNATRMYGTYLSDARHPFWRFWRASPLKVDLVARHLRRIMPAVRVRTIAESVVVDEAAAALLNRDVIMLCTDEYWGRSIVNQMAYQYLIPTVNLGVRIASEHGSIKAAVGNVDVLRPGQACLWCKQVLRAERIAAESMPTKDRQSREQEGYVEGLDTHTPAVINLNTTVAGLAVAQFVQLVTDSMGETGSVCRLNYDALSGVVSRGSAMIADGCVCQKFRGFGDLRPLATISRAAMVELRRQNRRNEQGGEG